MVHFILQNVSLIPSITKTRSHIILRLLTGYHLLQATTEPSTYLQTTDGKHQCSTGTNNFRFRLAQNSHSITSKLSFPAISSILVVFWVFPPLKIMVCREQTSNHVPRMTSTHTLLLIIYETSLYTFFSYY